MKYFLDAAKFLLLDLASTIAFVIVLLLTHSTVFAVVFGVCLGLAQIGFQLLRRKRVEPMEWLSLFLVVAGGGAALLTNDPRFVLFKPSIIYVLVGIVMLKPGWMSRYLPQIVRTVSPDIAIAVGFAWAGLMFVSAVVNAFVALSYSVSTWALVMPIFGLVTKVLLFLAGFAAIRLITAQRLRRMPTLERDALRASIAAQP
jgi:intracellular septation protein